jgi:hypothetical protein
VEASDRAGISIVGSLCCLIDLCYIAKKYRSKQYSLIAASYILKALSIHIAFVDARPLAGTLKNSTDLQTGCCKLALHYNKLGFLPMEGTRSYMATLPGYIHELPGAVMYDQAKHDMPLCDLTDPQQYISQQYRRAVLER